jgi:hypothetical protein
MGRQIGFYTTLADDAVLARMLRKEFDCTMLAWNMSVPEKPERIARLTPIKPGHNRQGNIILIPTELLSQLKVDEYGPKYWHINEHYSPVIVWSRSLASPTGSAAGRFWYETSKPGNKRKSKVFTEWADRIFGKVRWLFERHPRLCQRCLIGPDFLAQLATGMVSIGARK